MCVLTNNTSKQIFHPSFTVLRNSNTGVCMHVNLSARHMLFLDVTPQGQVWPFRRSVLNPRYTSYLPSHLTSCRLSFHLSHRPHWKLNEWTQYSAWQSPWNKVWHSVHIFNHYYYLLIDFNYKLDFPQSFCTTPWFIQSRIRGNFSPCQRSGQVVNCDKLPLSLSLYTLKTCTFLLN